MDLFVINRYREDEDNNIVNQETKHLEKLKKDIEERRKLYASTHTLDVNVKSSKPSSETKQSNVVKVVEKVLKDEIQVQTSPIEVDLKPHRQDKITHEFKVLGGNDFEQKPKVHRILPYWLSHPYSVSRNLQNKLHAIADQTWLHSTLKSTLESDGISHLFPVQAEVIPFILQEHELPQPLWPHDICVSAPTGSGKTLSFVIPIIQVLMKDVGHHIRAMVVLPVQELAAQIFKVFKKYCQRTGLKVALLSGSIPLHQEQQQIVRYTESHGWISEVDIIVCTAGRLVEHIQNTNGFSLKHLKFLVIDEADRIMENIQNDWLYHMDKHIKLENELLSGKVPNLNWDCLIRHKAPPHKLLFSATLSQDPEKLEQWGLFQPKLFSAAQVNKFEDEDHIRKYTTPDELKENFVVCSAEHKPLLLYHFLLEKDWDKVLCFTNAAQSAHRLTVLLNTWSKGKIKVAELSAALDRTTRDDVLRKFTQSEINVLIGTDALARGIDIPDCNYVISYDPPRNIKTYIHRVGRTGRAGRIGHAIIMLLPNQTNLFTEVLKSGGKSEIPAMNVHPDVFSRLNGSYEKAIEETKNLINSEIHLKVEKSIELKRGFKSRKRKAQ
ncbi:probable ATP-dependent RNA helicase Dbp73D [Ostrinia furnacalis]|uniref:probable ATP-dependent RNA helicase Dbp73D n=1 Tax=Ostrinia furnacalis TaxID=93504 RepID=UPI00103E7648|nr:probable ATP-dependent RNA helicase Dbp73D [Ostrinia furnacalis]